MRPRIGAALRELWGLLRGRRTAAGHRNTTRLPSSLDGAYFPATIEFDTAVAISPHEEIRIHQHIKELAAEVSRYQSVLDVDEARASVAERIDRAARSGEMRAGTSRIRVDLHPPDEKTSETARESDWIRLKTAVFREEKLAESSRLREFSKQILGNADTIRVWWLREDPSRLEDLIKLDERAQFTKAASMFGGADIGAVHQTADVLKQFLAELNPDQRRLLAMEFIDFLARFDRAGLIPQLRGAIESDAFLDGRVDHQP